MLLTTTPNPFCDNLNVPYLQMSRKAMNADDFDLSLTGSQISAASSGRKPNSSRGAGSPSVRRPSSAGSREKVIENYACQVALP